MSSQAGVNTVQHTLRAAVRIGEDFYTVEQVVTLPIGATDEQIQAATDLGLRIYVEQRASVEWQIGQIREAAPTGGAQPTQIREPEAPASDKQRNFIARLQDDLSWTSAQLVAFAAELGITDLVSLNKGQASTLIEAMKDRPRTPVVPAAPVQPAPRAPARPVTRNQPQPIADDAPHPAAETAEIPF